MVLQESKIMRCGSFAFQSNDKYRRTSPSLMGAGLAEARLIRASLQFNPHLRWDVWRASSNFLADNESIAVEPIVMEGEVNRRILHRPMNQFEEVAMSCPYLLAGSLPLLADLARFRSSRASPKVPVCGILHSLWIPDLFSTYDWLLRWLKTFDVMVATSAAAQGALRTVVTSLQETSWNKAAPLREDPWIEVIPLGVDLPAEDRLDRQAALRTLELPTDTFVILYLGRISQAYKADLEALISAAASLSGRGYLVHLILAGQAADSLYRKQLQNQIAAVGMTSRTLHFDNFPEFLKTTLIAAANVGVFPSDSIQESFGQALLETMAHARPVLASNWSGHRDLVLDGVTGFLIDTKTSAALMSGASDSVGLQQSIDLAQQTAGGTVVDTNALLHRLEWLASHPDAAVEMGRAARARASQYYSWPTVAGRYSELWAEQLRRAAFAPESGRERLPGLETIFQRYPSSWISSKSLISRSDIMQTRAVRDWNLGQIHSWEKAALVISTLQALEEGPLSFAELIAQGLAEEEIVFLAKKGVWTIS